MADFTVDDDALLAELGVEVPTGKASSRTPREERIIAGFEDIQRFFEQHGHAPLHGESRDIFERLYAVRFDRLRAQLDCMALLTPLDHQGLLAGDSMPSATEVPMDDDALLAELGVEAEAGSDITELKHVRPRSEVRAAEEIANRERCPDFDRFKPLFEAMQRDLDNGVRSTRPVTRDAGFLKADITQGQFFILGGQVAYVAEVGELIKAPNNEFDARLRVVYSNGTQSNLLRRSLQRALYKDEAGRRVTEPSAGPLFGSAADERDTESGTIYVLRSKADHPIINANRALIHKIGVTGGDLAARIAAAKTDATFLLADVELVASYELFNINRTKLENLLHTFFAPARLDLQIADRFGNPVRPREWFMVPLFVIDEAVERIRDGSLAEFVYDPKIASLRSIERDT